MGKQVFILNCLTGNAGVAKIISNKDKSTLTLNLSKRFPEIKKCHLYNGEKIIKSFEFKRNKNSFEYQNDTPIENIYLTTDDDNVIVWTGEFPKKVIKSEKQIPPEYFTFDNFFGGGFEWRRIRGNFLMFNYSILHYVISDSKVYQAINRSGFYTCGIKEDNEITFITIAIPIKMSVNPFENINADSYLIKSGKLTFSAICVGIDDTGEFFVSI